MIDILIIYGCRVDTFKQEVAQLKVEKRLSEAQWTGKEHNYKKAIEQLQSRVSLS